MAITRHHNSITIHVTPKILRCWADLCEKAWKKSLAGDSIIFHEIDDGDILLRLAFDQDKMNREKF